MATGESILVLGGTGLLGAALVRELRRRGRTFSAPRRDEVDLGDAATLERSILDLAPTAVFNAAAYTDVTRAEDPRELPAVTRLNRDAPGELARLCNRLGIALIHVSTDYVFDGRKREPYVESDRVAPLQVYGRSKLEGESAVLEAYPQATIARTSTLFGPGRRARPHYVDAVLRQAREKTRIEVVRLPVSSPTYAPDLACALIDLHDGGGSGLVHAVNAGGCSRLELAREAVRVAGYEATVEVLERAAPPSDLERPEFSVLEISRLGERNGWEMRSWQDALAEYVRRWTR